MITFTPPELREQLASAITRILNWLDCEGEDLIEDGYNPADDEFDEKYADEEDEVTVGSTLTIGLPRVESESLVLTYGEFIALVEEVCDSELVANVECWTRRRLLLRVTPTLTSKSMDLFSLMQHNSVFAKGAFETAATSGGTVLRCRVVEGYTPFAFAVTSRGYWDKYFPPVLSDDLFIEVVHNDAERDAVRAVVAAYSFELSSTVGLDLVHAPRPEGLYDDLLTSEDRYTSPPLRPLLLGNGLSNVLEAFNEAVAATDFKVQILLFCRIFEFVSATVVRLQLIRCIRAKLLSPGALDPSAQFILELEGLLEQQRTFRKDREAIVLTATTCCEATELARAAPSSLAKLRAVTATSKSKEVEEGLKEFGSCLVATRNQIAHAKSNYEPTGEECPADKIDEFAYCARVGAEQIIRWFGDLPPATRVC